MKTILFLVAFILFSCSSDRYVVITSDFDRGSIGDLEEISPNHFKGRTRRWNTPDGTGSQYNWHMFLIIIGKLRMAISSLKIQLLLVLQSNLMFQPRHSSFHNLTWVTGYISISKIIRVLAKKQSKVFLDFLRSMTNETHPKNINSHFYYRHPGFRPKMGQSPFPGPPDRLSGFGLSCSQYDRGRQ
jgi:hypothetical protein